MASYVKVNYRDVREEVYGNPLHFFFPVLNGSNDFICIWNHEAWCIFFIVLSDSLSNVKL